ncbi:MAG: AAA family ATPase [Lachnospiraceae bacterium]|nr:AAA family ATPase [Lachnospiraceae bacterium]
MKPENETNITADEETALEEKHLKETLALLHTEIEKVKYDMEVSRIDAERQKEYYWENYSEFDEYGYEHFDNEQQLYATAYTQGAKAKELSRYEKMLDSAYFARVDFVYDGEDEPETYYIGMGNFSPEKTLPPVIFDWRAPVSALFYDYDRGPAGFDAPAGRQEGEILQKKQYKIRHGKLIFFFSCDMKIDDDVLKRELSANADYGLKAIVTTIQKEQNHLIRADRRENLVIQGVAGSGKTSVALHRIAYLLYHNRETLQARNVLTLTPNAVFADYISHILPELGEEPIRQMSFDDFAARELRHLCVCEDRYDYMERLLWIEQTKGPAARADYVARYRERQSESWCGEIFGFLLLLEQDIADFRPFTWKNFSLTAQEISSFFYGSLADVPILQRMDRVAEYVIDRIETLKNRDLEDEAKDKILRKLRSMYRTTDVVQLYFEFLSSMGDNRYAGEASGGCGRPEEAPLPKIYYEDVFPLLYFKYLASGKKEHHQVKHLVVDEMQDYSYLQYELLHMMFSCPMTMLGDRHQTLTEEREDVTGRLAHIFGKKMTYYEMNRSYRSTVEIGEFADGLIGNTGTVYFPRHGRAPAKHAAGSAEEAVRMVAEALPAQLEKYEIVGILCRSAGEAAAVYGMLKDCMPESAPEAHMGEEGIPEESMPQEDTSNADLVTLLDRDSGRFRGRIMVTTWYLAKGLEFDAVHCLYPKREAELLPHDRQAVYLAATRAMHELDLYFF